MLICIKQHLSNIWSSIQEKLRNTEAELKKSDAYKKGCTILKICWSLKWNESSFEFVAKFAP